MAASRGSTVSVMASRGPGRPGGAPPHPTPTTAAAARQAVLPNTWAAFSAERLAVGILATLESAQLDVQGALAAMANAGRGVADHDRAQFRLVEPGGNIAAKYAPALLAERVGHIVALLRLAALAGDDQHRLETAGVRVEQEDRRRIWASLWRMPCRSMRASISTLPEAMRRVWRRSRSVRGGGGGRRVERGADAVRPSGGCGGGSSPGAPTRETWRAPPAPSR